MSLSKTLIISFTLCARYLFNLSRRKKAGNGHEHSEQDIGIMLNEGKKWKADAPLRQGMDSIHQAIE